MVKTNWVPSRKVISGGVVSLTAWAILTGLGYFNVPIPLELQVALPAILGSITQYLVPPSAKDVIRRIDDKLVAIAGQSEESAVSPSVGELAGRVAAATEHLVRR